MAAEAPVTFVSKRGWLWVSEPELWAKLRDLGLRDKPGSPGIYPLPENPELLARVWRLLNLDG